MPNSNPTKAIYNPQDEPLVIHKGVLDQILSSNTDYPAQCIALYVFSYALSKWDCAKFEVTDWDGYYHQYLHMDWGGYLAAKNTLMELGLFNG